MEHLDLPNKTIWEERQLWFENQLNEVPYPYASYLVSDHATALLVDLQACYCAGAWIAVIILSVSVIDAQLRETEAMNGKIGTAKLLKAFYSGQGIDWLMKLRSSYVYIDIDLPALTIDDQYTDRKNMEENAKKAIGMVIHSFFQSPGV